MSRLRVARVCGKVAVLLALAAVASCGRPAPPAATSTTSTTAASEAVAPRTEMPATTTPSVAPAPEFAPIAQLVNEAVAARRLPGAVVQIGHSGRIVFRQAFGERKLAGEPGLDGSPAPAEPMTEDTIFDLASLTKSVATAPAVLQMYEQGRIQLDDPVQAYLPGFNPDNDPRRARVTLRMLMTHTSGIAGDLSLDGPWGLSSADKAEGLHRALGAWVVFEPGERFHYSDINFILLGAIVEKLTGEPIDTYVQQNVFTPLGMRDTQGKTLLVVGAAGGVGSILIQLAKQLTDITVIGTASRPESQAWVTSLGADAVIDHRQPLDEALKAAGYEQVDMVVSLNQTDHHFEAIINALKPQGKLALIDDPELIDVRKLKLKSLSLHWELMFTRPLFTTEDIAKQHDLLSEVAAMVDSGRLTTTLGEVLGPINADNLTRAHALIESNRTVGKLVLEGF